MWLAGRNLEASEAKVSEKFGAVFLEKFQDLRWDSSTEIHSWVYRCCKAIGHTSPFELFGLSDWAVLVIAWADNSISFGS